MIPDPHDDIRWCYDVLSRSEVRDHDYERAFEVLDRELSTSERPIAMEGLRKLHGLAPIFRRVITCQGVLAQHVADLETTLDEVA